MSKSGCCGHAGLLPSVAGCWQGARAMLLRFSPLAFAQSPACALCCQCGASLRSACGLSDTMLVANALLQLSYAARRRPCSYRSGFDHRRRPLSYCHLCAAVWSSGMILAFCQRSRVQFPEQPCFEQHACFQLCRGCFGQASRVQLRFDCKIVASCRELEPHLCGLFAWLRAAF